MLQDRTEVGSNPVQWTDLNKLEHAGTHLVTSKIRHSILFQPNFNLPPQISCWMSSFQDFFYGLNPQGDGRGLFHVIEQLAALEVEIASFWMKLGKKNDVENPGDIFLDDVELCFIDLIWYYCMWYNDISHWGVLDFLVETCNKNNTALSQHCTISHFVHMVRMNIITSWVDQNRARVPSGAFWMGWNPMRLTSPSFAVSEPFELEVDTDFPQSNWISPVPCFIPKPHAKVGSLRKQQFHSYTVITQYREYIYIHMYNSKNNDDNNDNNINIYIIIIIEGSLEVKLPTIWTVEKQRWDESEETRSEERRCRCAKR